ncbi:MAG: hypothetical protein MR420_03945 [Spirochaetia bacterium]|nr:hypothetical protein [Spirochaetia bacterium]
MRDSKPRNNALHAFCGIETIELPLRSSHKKSVFEPRPAPSHQHYGKVFIMRLPWDKNECCCFKRKTNLQRFQVFHLSRL